MRAIFVILLEQSKVYPTTHPILIPLEQKHVQSVRIRDEESKTLQSLAKAWDLFPVMPSLTAFTHSEPLDEVR